MKNNNGKIWKILTVLAIITIAAAGVVYGYGKLNGRVEAVEKRVEKTEDTRERLIRLEEGVEYLKKAIDRIEDKP